eukprot:2444821-Amphidinium_carterae.1
MVLLGMRYQAGFFYFFLARICTGVAIGGSFPVLFSLCAEQSWNRQLHSHSSQKAWSNCIFSLGIQSVAKLPV